MFSISMTFASGTQKIKSDSSKLIGLSSTLNNPFFVTVVDGAESEAKHKIMI